MLSHLSRRARAAAIALLAVLVPPVCLAGSETFEIRPDATFGVAPKEFALPLGAKVGVIVRVSQTGILLQGKRLYVQARHPLEAHELANAPMQNAAGREQATQAAQGRAMQSAVQYGNGSFAAGALGTAMGMGFVALDNYLIDSRIKGLTEHVGTIWHDRPWSAMLQSAVGGALEKDFASEVDVVSFAERETLPDDVEYTLWVVGGHEFSLDARRLLFMGAATLCPGRVVESERCKPLYENLLAYHFALAPGRDVTGDKLYTAWAEPGADGLDALAQEAFTGIGVLLRYDVENLGTEKSGRNNQKYNRAEAGYGTTVNRVGDRIWFRLYHGAALHSLPLFDAPQKHHR